MALREVFSHPSSTVGKDLLQTLQDYALEHSDDLQRSPVDVFLREIRQVKWRTRDWLGCKRVIGHNRWIIIHLMLSSIHFSVDSAESGPETNMSSPYTNASGAVRAFNTCKCV